MEYFELIVYSNQSSDCLTPATKKSSFWLRCGRTRSVPNQHKIPSRRLSFLCQFARAVLNPYIDQHKIPTTSPSSGRRSPSGSSEQASLSMGAMKYAPEVSKTAISSSSSSALLLFGTSLLTISRHRAETFMCQRQFLGLRLEFLANQPASIVWSTWVDRVYLETLNRHNRHLPGPPECPRPKNNCWPTGHAG